MALAQNLREISDQRRACFDKLSMRIFFLPLRLSLVLNLSKDPGWRCNSPLGVICVSPA
jgi:hypothetical protein